MDLISLAPLGVYLRGKFHAHITVDLNSVVGGLEKLKFFCSQIKGAKPTIVDLKGFDGRLQVDGMLTKHYLNNSTNAVEEIANDLELVSSGLIQIGLPILRVKLEHESLPTLNEFTSLHYREVHAKLEFPKEAHESVMNVLMANASKFNYAQSSNLYSIDGLIVGEFLTVRHYFGTLDDVNSKTEDLVAFLESEKISVRELKEETTIIDSNPAIDSWWV